MKKVLVSILVLVMVTSMFVGCSKDDGTDEGDTSSTQGQTSSDSSSGDSESSDTTDSEVASEPVTIKVTSGLWSKPEEQQYVREELLTAFEEETGITVELEVLAGNDILDLLASYKETGEWASDVLITHSGDMSKYIDNGYAQPINDIAGNMTILPAFNDATMVGGDTYYIPISADVYLVVANNKALDYMPAGADIDTLTWEQYVDWAIAIADGEGTAKTAMPALNVKSMCYQVGGMGLSYGADFAEIDSDPMKEVWGLVGEMIEAGAIVEDSFQYGDPVDLMKAETAWLSFYHMGPVGQIYSAAPAEFSIGPAPAGPVGNGSIAGAWGIGMTSGTEQAEAAQQFIEFMTRPENLYMMTQGIGGTIPPVQEVVDVLGSEPADDVVKKGLLTLETGIPHGVPAADYTDWGAVKTVYDETFKAIWDANGVVDDAMLAEQQAALEALLVE